MGLFDLFKKKKADDGTYRNPGRDSESFRFTVQECQGRERGHFAERRGERPGRARGCA